MKYLLDKLAQLVVGGDMRSNNGPIDRQMGNYPKFPNMPPMSVYHFDN